MGDIAPFGRNIVYVWYHYVKFRSLPLENVRKVGIKQGKVKND